MPRQSAGTYKLQPHWALATQNMVKMKRQQVLSVGKDAEQSELWYTAGENEAVESLQNYFVLSTNTK